MLTKTRILLASLGVLSVICIVFAGPIFELLTNTKRVQANNQYYSSLDHGRANYVGDADLHQAVSTANYFSNPDSGDSKSILSLSAAPSVTGLTPSNVTAGSTGFTLSVEGVDLRNDFVIRINGTDRPTVFISSTQLTTPIDASEIATAGTLAVAVFDPTSGENSAPVVFTVNNPAPALSTISPSTKIAGDAPFVLTLNGTNFCSGSLARFNGLPRTTTFISSTQLSAQILAADVQSIGVFPITVVNPTPGGGTSSELDFTVNNPVPALTSMTPNNAVAGGGPFTLTVTGSNFVSGAVVRWNGANRPTTLINGTQATAQLTAADLTDGGTFNITITNPFPGGGTSGGLSFAITSPVPTLSTINPNSRTAGGGLFTLTVTGTNFVGNSVVRFNGSNRPTTFVNSSQLTAQIAAADTTLAGSYPITVFSPTPGGGVTSGVNLAVNNPIPTVSTISPVSRMAGDPGFTLTVNGSNFNSSSTVRFGGSNRTTTLVSSSRLTAQITPADIATAGSYPITVFNAAPGGGTSNAVNLAVASPPVSIGSISPASRTAGGANFTLTLTGTNFTSGSVVQFNGTARVTTFISATQISAAILAADIALAGTYQITVSNSGSISNVVNLSVTPVLSNLSPTSARAGGAGFTLTVNGLGFVNGSIVRLNGVNSSTTFISATQLTATIQPTDLTAAGTLPISVVTPAPSNLSSGSVNLSVTPGISNLSPMTAATGSGAFTLIVEGAGFINGSVVRWNGSNRTTTFVNSTKLTAAITATDVASTGTFPVTVRNSTPTTLTSNAINFKVTITPPASECAAGTDVTLADPGLINSGPARSQMWYNDGIWWGAFSNNTDGIYFYRQTGPASWMRGDLIDTNMVAGVFLAGSPDCLWDGTNLFVLIQESTLLAKLYKYSYSTVTKTHTLNPGFPVSLPLTGVGTSGSGKLYGTLALDKDSTGKLWAAYTGSGAGGDGNMHVIWSTSPDHITWNTTGLILEAGLSLIKTEGSAIVRFGGNKIGVAWSNQMTGQLGFRYHTDGQLETTWSAKEVIDSGLGPEGTGSVAGRQVTMKAAPDGRIFFASDDNDGINNHLHLYLRTVAGSWGQKTLIVNNFDAMPSKPTLLLDTDNSIVHIIYKDNAVGSNGLSGQTFITQSSMTNLAFNAPCLLVDTSDSILSTSNPTTTKQNVNATMDLVVAASTGRKGNAILVNTVDLTPNVVTIFNLSPQEVTAGESTASLNLTVNGKLFVSGAIARLNGVNRTTTFVNAGKLSATLPVADTAAPGVLPISVINPNLSVSNTKNLVVTAANPVPTVTRIFPDRELVGSPQFTMTITGTGFRRTSKVRFNGSDRTTTFVTDTTLSATIPASDLLVAGPYPITVVNPVPGGGTSSAKKNTTFFVEPPCASPIPAIFSGITVFNTNKAQMWYNDSLWWGAFSDNRDGVYFYKQSGASFTKGALIDGNYNGRPDVLWNGNNLFILVYELNTQARLYKYSYNPATQTHTLVTGFPTTLPLIGIGAGVTQSETGSITMAQDSTGKLWATYPGTGPGGDSNYRVIWSTSADHKTWDTNGFILASGGTTLTQEVTTIVHFGGNKIGVAWSNQVVKEDGFRYHLDGDPENVWSTKEVIDFGLGNEEGLGGVADNHMSIKSSPDGRIFLIAKDSDNVGYLHLYTRSSAGVWSEPVLVDIDPHAAATRPTLLLDLENSEVYVLYEDATQSLMYVSHTSMNTPVFGPACPYVSQAYIVNVTSTKQNLKSSMGLMAAGSTATGDLYVNPLTIAAGSGNMPSLVSISPSSQGANEGSFVLTVNGSNFASNAVVYFNGSDRATTFVSSSQLTARLLATDLENIGTFPITVMNPRGGTSTSIGFNINASIGSLAPFSAAAGSGSFLLTLTGNGFINGNVVYWNGQPHTTNFISSTQLTAQITAQDIQTAGIVPVIVVIPGGIASAPKDFTISNPAPTIVAMSPASAVLGSGAFTLTVNGTNFNSSSRVRFNGGNRTTNFLSTTQVTAQVSPADIAAAGAFSVTVSNPAPGGGTTSPSSFQVLNPTPTLNTITPLSVMVGTGALTLTVSGSGFVPDSVVSINGSDRPTSFVSANQLTAQINAADVQTIGTFPITVFSPAPGGGSSSPSAFTVSNPSPSLTSISPTNKTSGDIGFTLTVNGGNYNNTSIVRFNGSNRATTFVSGNQLLAQITAADLAVADSHLVEVFNPAPGGGTSASANLNINNPLPTISSLSPTQILEGSNSFTLIVNGGNFVSGTVVQWNGENRSTSFISPTQVTAQITMADISSHGMATVTVTNSAPGGGISNTLTFSIDPNARVVSAVSNSGSSNSIVTIPIRLAAQGDENALAFTLSFDPALLSNPQAALSADASGAMLNTDSGNVDQGRFGATVLLPAGQVFAAGTRQIIDVTFNTATVGTQTNTPVNFIDQPIIRQVSDVDSIVLPALYSSGIATIVLGYEADVAPRPNGSNNGSVSVADWAQIGRFTAGIDTTSSGSEFQRADCAPKGTLGGGSLTIADWVQAGRYASGLDQVVPAGGPTGAAAASLTAGTNNKSAMTALAPTTRVRLVETEASRAMERRLSLEVEAQGNENALGFSLLYDPDRISFIEVEKSQTFGEAILNVNSKEAEQGRVGITLALPAGRTFGPGTHQVLMISFKSPTSGGEPIVTFGDTPVSREVVDVNALPVRSSFEEPETSWLGQAQFFGWPHHLNFLSRYLVEYLQASGSPAFEVSQTSSGREGRLLVHSRSI